MQTTKKAIKNQNNFKTVSNQEIINACLSQNISKLTNFFMMDIDLDKVYDAAGDPLLHIAILNNKPLSFNTLIAYGLNIENYSKLDGTTALNLASLAHKVEFAKILLDHGANVNTQAYDGSTPLFNAIYSKNDTLAQMLLKVATLDVNISNKDCYCPPLFIAYAYAQWDIIDKIVNHPSFDLTFHLIVANESENHGFKDFLFSLVANQDLTALDVYQQVKNFAMKYEFDGSFNLSNVDTHQFSHFTFDGYSNPLGAKAMAESFSQFYNNIVHPSFIPTWAKQVFVNINDSLQFTANVFDPLVYYNKIALGDTVIIPSGWDGHSIVFVIEKDKLYRCNRGDQSDGIHGIEEFQITKAGNLSTDLINKMLEAKGAPDLFQYDIIEILGLQKVGEIENPTQLVGNCVWASLEAGIEASFVNNFLDIGFTQFAAHTLAKETYNLWKEFDLNNALKETINNSEVLSHYEIYDDLLIHSLDNHHNPLSEPDIQKGVVVLSQLANPFVLETFDKLIGQDILSYDPQSYSSISYMHSYQPQKAPSYLEILWNWLYPNNPNFTDEKLLKVKDYYQFLKACDNYQQHLTSDLLNITDILDTSNPKPLENLFNTVPGAPQTDGIFNVMPVLPILPAHEEVLVV